MKPFIRFLIAFLVVLAAFGGTSYALMGSRIFAFPHLLPILVMVPAMALGIWLQARLRRRSIAQHVRCGGCGYDLTGHAAVLRSPGAACPECGARFDEVACVEAGTPHPAELARRQMRFQVSTVAIGTLLLAVVFAALLARGGARDYTWPAVVVGLGVVAPWISVAVQYRRLRRGGKPPKRD